jgi:hypothetical protein
MGAIITSHVGSFTIDLNGISADRIKARIKTEDIRSVVADTDGATVEIIFSSGEIQAFPYQAIESIDGDTSITSQAILYDKMEVIIFG